MLFGAAHGGAFLRGVVVCAGEVIESMGDVECQFGVGAIMHRAFTQSTFNIHNKITGGFVFFTGNGVVAEADDIGGPVFS